MSSLQGRARGAGAIYLLMSILGAPALLLVPKYVVDSDATATVQRILANEQTYRYLVLGDALGSIGFAVLGWSLYHLFADVDRRLSLLLLVLVLVSSTMGVVDAALIGAPLALHAHADALTAFTPAQVDALAYGVLKIRSMEVNANQLLWGFWLVPFAALIWKSGFIPKIIGVLLVIAGAGYVAMSVTYFAWPAHVEAVDRVAMILIQGELPVILWLLIVGARAPRGAAQREWAVPA